MQPSAHKLPAGLAVREAHAHLLWHGQAMDRVDLSACTSAQEALELVAQRRRDRDGPIVAGGARPDAWDPPGWPALAELDQAAGARACTLWCFDTHSAMASSAALSSAGLTADAPDPADGVIGRDGRGGLTGVLSESAVEPLRRIEEEDEHAARRHVELALGDLADHGFSEVHDLKTQPFVRDILREVHGRGMRLVLHPLVEDLGEFARTRDEWETDNLRLGGGKIFVDGTLNSRTARMLDDWCDAGASPHPRGVQMMPESDIERAIRTCDGLGVPMAAHAIGDAAVRAVLDAIERVRPETTGFRIEHCQFVHPADAPRFAELGVIASVQPCHLLYDIEALHRATPDRLDRVLPLRSLIDAGCTPGASMIFGSDTPVVRPDPGDSLQAAIERRRVDMDATEAIAAQQAISYSEAVACFRCPSQG